VLFFFRNIQFTTAISLALYTGLLHLVAITGRIAPVSVMNDAGLPFNSLFGAVQSQPFWSAVAATILVYVQALLLNNVADSFRLMHDRNWLPGMAYVLVVSLLPDFQFLSAPLVATTALILAINSVFKTYKSAKSAVLVFDAGFWIAVASLFYPKALLLTVAMFISIGVMRSWNVRDQIAFLTGVFIPNFLGWLWYFWADMGSVFRSVHFGHLVQLYRFDVAFDTNMLIRCILTGTLLFFALINFGTFSRNKSMQGQKCVEVLYWFLFTGTIMMFLRHDWRWEAILLTATPLGIFLAMTYQTMRNLFAEGLHLFLLGAVLLLQFFG
jgi:hypothetical protein